MKFYLIFSNHDYVFVTMYYDTLSVALDAARASLVERGAEIAPGQGCPFTFGGISYNSHKEGHYELSSLKGKPTKKWAHITIWRHESGRYEENNYIL